MTISPFQRSYGVVVSQADAERDRLISRTTGHLCRLCMRCKFDSESKICGGGNESTKYVVLISQTLPAERCQIGSVKGVTNCTSKSVRSIVGFASALSNRVTLSSKSATHKNSSKRKDKLLRMDSATCMPLALCCRHMSPQLYCCCTASEQGLYSSQCDPV